jgi:hypothetical protein
MNVAGLVAIDPEDTEPSQPVIPAPLPATQPALPAGEIDALIKQLDDDKYTVREAAQKKLQDQGVAVLPRLREELGKDKLSAEVRSRLEAVVKTLAATTQPVRPRRPNRVEIVDGIRAVTEDDL